MKQEIKIENKPTYCNAWTSNISDKVMCNTIPCCGYWVHGRTDKVLDGFTATEGLKRRRMTPKEKAKELVDTFYETTPNETFIDEPLGEFMKIYTAWGQAKQCALIAVDEIMKAVGWGKMELGVDRDNYWEEVKQEIDKL
tara:strand:- start:61 stop:480 length:420 start_codon:yes stop_codon:yes gene_type:complete